jgi:hypothetical protein
MRLGVVVKDGIKIRVRINLDEVRRITPGVCERLEQWPGYRVVSTYEHDRCLNKMQGCDVPYPIEAAFVLVDLRVASIEEDRMIRQVTSIFRDEVAHAASHQRT